jgi:beta-1,4-N-acetylglucosaminyltransferase
MMEGHSTWSAGLPNHDLDRTDGVLPGEEKERAKSDRMKLALVCSHGGHLTQMLMLLPAFGEHQRFFVTYNSVRTEGLAKQERVYLLANIGANPLLMATAFLRALRILLKERPEIVISTGSEIAIPFSWMGKLLGARVIYIETWSRITSPSGTGKIVYFIADVFFVQWEQLLSCYGPKAQYEGSVF